MTMSAKSSLSRGFCLTLFSIMFKRNNFVEFINLILILILAFISAYFSQVLVIMPAVLLLFLPLASILFFTNRIIYKIFSQSKVRIIINRIQSYIFLFLNIICILLNYFILHNYNFLLILIIIPILTLIAFIWLEILQLQLLSRSTGLEDTNNIINESLIFPVPFIIISFYFLLNGNTVASFLVYFIPASIHLIITLGIKYFKK